LHSTRLCLFCGGFFERVLRTICLGWLQTVILLICASWVARISGVSHQDLASSLCWLFQHSTSWVSTVTGETLLIWQEKNEAKCKDYSESNSKIHQGRGTLSVDWVRVTSRERNTSEVLNWTIYWISFRFESFWPVGMIFWVWLTVLLNERDYLCKLLVPALIDRELLFAFPNLCSINVKDETPRAGSLFC
jgi:hypothetical protein